MSDAGDRPQDVERPHKRRGPGDPRDDAILERYRAAMRAELADLLAELRPATGQLELGGAPARPSLEQRRALWDLAVKIGRELGSVPLGFGWADEQPPGEVPVRRPRSAPRLTAAQRRQLGGS